LISHKGFASSMCKWITMVNWWMYFEQDKSFIIQDQTATTPCIIATQFYTYGIKFRKLLSNNVELDLSYRLIFLKSILYILFFFYYNTMQKNILLCWLWVTTYIEKKTYYILYRFTLQLICYITFHISSSIKSKYIKCFFNNNNLIYFKSYIAQISTQLDTNSNVYFFRWINSKIFLLNQF